MNTQLVAIIKNHFRDTFFARSFVPGESNVPVSGKVFDENELMYGVQAVLDGWWTEGEYAEKFEKAFSGVVGARYISLVNSGSSANLIAVSSLTSSVFGAKALNPGDEVITVATGFPTTVNPIIQNRCIPVFIDNDIKTKNATIKEIVSALSKKTKAIMLAHTLGNPLPLDEIAWIVKERNLWFIEDCCDALGSTYKGKHVGTFGDVATFSFYPAHQITMGEGGAVATQKPLIHKAIRQFRDWGRDCWCDTGKDNTCGKRFKWQLGDLPMGYDHKYIYSQIGYNVKLTDMQAAIGLAQLEKLPVFIAKRKHNFSKLLEGLSCYSTYLTFSNAEEGSDPCWFGFAIVVNKIAPFTKLELVEYLEKKKIGTRSLFAGNLLKHPAYKGREGVRVSGALANSDTLMENGFWIGLYPGITDEMIHYIVSAFNEFFARYLH